MQTKGGTLAVSFGSELKRITSTLFNFCVNRKYSANLIALTFLKLILSGILLRYISNELSGFDSSPLLPFEK